MGSTIEAAPFSPLAGARGKSGKHVVRITSPNANKPFSPKKLNLSYLDPQRWAPVT